MSTINDSLSAIDSMFSDFLSEHGDSPYLAPEAIALIEGAQRMLYTARVVPMRDPGDHERITTEEAEHEALLKRLTPSEKQLLRRATQRELLAIFLGSSSRLIDMGVLVIDGDKVRPTCLGLKLNQIMR